jgi:hypothetical protein
MRKSVPWEKAGGKAAGTAAAAVVGHVINEQYGALRHNSALLHHRSVIHEKNFKLTA